MELVEALMGRDRAAVAAILADRPRAALEPTPQGISPLMLALYLRFEDGVDALLRVVEPGPFELAVLGDVRCVAALEDPSDRGPDGFTALHLAAHFGHAHLVPLLVRSGCPVDVVGGPPHRNRPLHAAAAGGSVEAIQALLASGADMDGLDGAGNTALMVATASRHLTAARMLLAAGADAGVVNDKGETARSLAVDRGYPELVKLLR